MLYICVSFDYELFMGENLVSENDLLFRPTKKLCDMLQNLGISATFFADVCCPMAYRRFGKTEFADEFDKQLRYLTQQGHDVQLHIHPHWEAVTQVGKNIEFPENSYRLHHWMGIKDGDTSVAQRMIRDGINYLQRNLIAENRDYRCVAFRAGGYCLQPEKELTKILYEEGIRIDSSVCRGMAYNGAGMFYDYRVDPKVNNVYINAEYGLSDNQKEKLSESILEIPVASYSTYPFRLIALKKNRRMQDVAYRGRYMKINNNSSARKRSLWTRAASKIKRLLDIHESVMVTFDSFSSEAMIYMLRRMAKECGNRDIYVATIAHPKIQSDEHIENMRQTIEMLQRMDNIRFASMRQIADQLRL